MSADNRVPPASPETEKLVLGAITANPEQFQAVADLVTADDFYSRKHKLIFESMKRLDDSGASIDYRSIYEDLKRHGEEGIIGGISYLVSLSEDLPTVYGIESYCRIVTDKAVRRRAIAWANAFAERCETEDSDALISEADKIAELVCVGAQREIEALDPSQVQEREGGSNVFLQPNKNPGIRIPFPTINRILSGLRRSKLVLIGARPGIGKTSLAWQCAESAAISGHRVLFVSLEMSARDLLHRGLTGRAGVDAYKFRHGQLSPEEKERLYSSWTEILELGDRLLIYDKDDATVPSISALIRTLTARDKKPALVLVDYVQILKPAGRFENRTQEVSAMSRGLLSIARKFDIPVVALTQLNRDFDKPGADPTRKEAREPELSSIKESSQLEQDAHQILFLWAGATNEKAATQIVNWKVAKNRDGALNRGKLVFQREHARFGELEAVA